jgi:hypothetical protein
MAIGMTKISNAAVIDNIPTLALDTLEWASVETEGTVIDVLGTEQVIDCMLQIRMTFNASSTLGAELHLRYSVDGSTVDTEELKTFATAIDTPGSATELIFTHRVPGMFDYLDVGIKNLDSAQDITAIYVDATYTKLTGLAIA